MKILSDIKLFQDEHLKQYCTSERLAFYQMLDNVCDCMHKIEVTNDLPTKENFDSENAAIRKTITDAA